MKNIFVVSYHNVLRYVKSLFCEGKAESDLSEKSGSRKKETGFKNGRLLADENAFVGKAIQPAQLKLECLELAIKTWSRDGEMSHEEIMRIAANLYEFCTGENQAPKSYKFN